MQSFGFTLALGLLGTGAVLNTTVLVFLVLRSVRAYRVPRRLALVRAVANAHR